ncbi:Transformation/transcription domain-associated protein, partial [Orchesella cincta]
VPKLSFFRETWQEEQLKQLKTALASCYRVAFENQDSILITSLTPEIAGRINKMGLGFQFTQFPQDPWFGWMKTEFEKDFGHLASPQELLDVIQKLLKWIEIFEGNVKALPSLVLCDERSKLLLSFSMDVADVKLPGEFLIPKTPHYSMRIARFEAKLDVVVKPGSSGKRLTIRAHNGKVYPYLVANNSEPSEWEGERREERVLQLLRILNNYLGKQKETAKRSMRFMVPKLVAVSPQLRLAEDYPASLSLLEMFKLACSKQGFEADSLVLSYYQKLGAIQGKGEQLTHGALRDIFQGIQQGLVSVDVLKDWAVQNFVSASDYWMFRKTFTTQMCLNILAEYAFQLTSLKPEGLNIHPDTGLVNISYFKFDTDASQPPVPFRLTSNLYEFMTENGLAKCLTYPNYKLEAILRPILKDEILANLKRNESKNCLGWETPMETFNLETVTDLVINAASAIMTRLSRITGGKVNELIAAASKVDN